MKSGTLKIRNFFFENIVAFGILSKFFLLFHFLIAFFLTFKDNKKEILISYKKIFQLLIFFLIFFLLINVFNEVNLKNNFKFFLLFTIPFIVITISVYYSQNKKLYIETIKFVFYLCLVLIFDIFFYKYSNFSFLINWHNPITQSRFASIFFDEEILGFFLCSCIPLINLYLKKYSQNYQFKNYLIFLIFLLFILAIYFTGERRAFYLSIFTVFLLYFPILTKIKNKKKFLVSGIFILAIVFVLIFKNLTNGDKINFNNNLSSRMFLKTFDTILTLPLMFEDSAKYSEYIKKNKIGDWFLLYRNAILLNNDSPVKILFGSGYKKFGETCSKKFENCASHPHNMFLEIYFSFGIIGLLVFISFIITAIYNLYKYKYSYEMIVFLIVFFFPILPSGSILSMNLIYHISIFSILFIADYKLNKFNHV